MEEDKHELCILIILIEHEQGKSQWIRTLKKYMQMNNITLMDIRSLTKKKSLIKRRWDTKMGIAEVQEKINPLNEKYLKNVGKEAGIDNTEESKLLIRGRTNTLILN